MTLHETYAAMHTAEVGKIIFLLDASESAAQRQSAIVSLTREVLSALPARVERALYFLGNPTAYEPHNFAGRAMQWFKENERRASLVTPVWDTFKQDDPSTIVVIGSGRIFDLEDWHETPLWQRVLLVSMEELLQGESATAEEMVGPSAQELLQRLHDPVIRVEISGPGFMPTLWNNAGYQLTTVGHEVSLIAERLSDYALTLQFFAMQEGVVQAVMTHASGKQSVVMLQPVEPIAVVGPKTGKLSAKEVEIFCKAVKREPFACVHCGEQHSWDTLRCQASTIILGKLVYPSLQSCNATGLVVFRAMEEGIQFEQHLCTVLRLGSGEVAVKDGQRVRLYRFEVQGEVWLQTDDVLEPYSPVGEQAYAVLL